MRRGASIVIERETGARLREDIKEMITLEDCVAFCGLTEEEVLAIAEHEHIPEIAAAALAETLLGRAHGAERIHVMIVEDIRNALARGDKKHAAALLAALRHFLSSHPEVIASTSLRKAP